MTRNVPRRVVLTPGKPPRGTRRQQTLRGDALSGYIGGGGGGGKKKKIKNRKKTIFVFFYNFERADRGNRRCNPFRFLCSPHNASGIVTGAVIRTPPIAVREQYSRISSVAHKITAAVIKSARVTPRITIIIIIIIHPSMFYNNIVGIRVTGDEEYRTIYYYNDNVMLLSSPPLIVNFILLGRLPGIGATIMAARVWQHNGPAEAAPRALITRHYNIVIIIQNADRTRRRSLLVRFFSAPLSTAKWRV